MRYPSLGLIVVVACLAALAGCSSSSSSQDAGSSGSSGRSGSSGTSASHKDAGASASTGHSASTNPGTTSGSAASTSGGASGSASSRGHDAGHLDADEDAPPHDATDLDSPAPDGAGAAVVSCTFTVQGMDVCTQIDGLGLDASNVEETACTSGNGGVFAHAACAGAGASGTCTFVSTGTGLSSGIPAGLTVVYVYYSLTTQQVAAAQQSCTQNLGGVWSGS